jgi:hypothetical protein
MIIPVIHYVSRHNVLEAFNLLFTSSLYIGYCDGVRLPSQNCGLGLVVLSPSDSSVDLVDEIG